MDNQVLSEVITGKDSKEFKDKLDKFLQRDVVIGSTQFSTCPRFKGATNASVMHTEGVYYSCLIFYSMRR